MTTIINIPSFDMSWSRLTGNPFYHCLNLRIRIVMKLKTDGVIHSLIQRSKHFRGCNSEDINKAIVTPWNENYTMFYNLPNAHPTRDAWGVIVTWIIFRPISFFKEKKKNNPTDLRLIIIHIHYILQFHFIIKTQ